MHKDLFIRLCWLCASLLLGSALLIRLVVLVATPQSHLRDFIDFIYDDGYYYLGIAANVADSGHSTLDGVSATNGYQPLWLVILSGLAAIVGTKPHTFFLASCTLLYAIALLAPLLALRWWKSYERYLPLSIAAGVAVVVIQQPGVFLEGLEPILIAPLIVPLVVLIERGEDSKVLLGLSAVLAAAFLVRLDALALYFAAIVGIPLAEVVADRLRLRHIVARTIQVALRLSTIVVPTVLIYVALNYWLFGSPVPVSGVAKLLGGPTFGNWGVIAMFFARWRSLALLLVVLAPLELLVRMSGQRAQPVFYRSLLIVSLALTVQAFYYAAFSAWNVWPWYAYLIAVDMAIVIARIIYLCSLLYTHERLRFAGFAAIALVGAWAAHRSAAFAFKSLPPTLQTKLAFVTKFGIAGTGEGASFNQISLDMLDDFFTTDRHTTIAMGDRAGGIAYWGREKVSVVQAEGLTLDVEYLRARAALTGEKYFAERFPIQYWVVDREFIPTVQVEGQTVYVVPEPIQGRVTTAPVPTFCFPASAIRYQKPYPSAWGINTRIAFVFAQRVPCTAAALALVRAAEQGMGLRQFSLPTEYKRELGGTMDKQSEDRDRHYKTR
jgi:hypothetical protein